MAIIKDETLAEITEQIGRKNAVLQKFINAYDPTALSWLTVQANVRAGKGKAKYAIGDELIGSYTASNGVTYECPWVVVDNDREVEWEDGTKHPGLFLQMKYATNEAVQFDAPEDTVVPTSETTALADWYYWGVTGSNYTALNLSTGATIPHGSYDSIHKCGMNDVNVLRYGYNRWRDSGKRQWLNSAGGVGEWWESTHTGDIAPTQLGSIRGFMAGLDSEFLSVVTSIKIKTSCNTVTDGGVTDTTVDKFWLPSIEEMYGAPQVADIEGPYFPYWKQKTGLENPSNDAVSGRIITAIENHNSAQTCRLRSAHRGYSYGAWLVTTAGYLNYTYASTAYGCAPACVIS